MALSRRTWIIATGVFAALLLTVVAVGVDPLAAALGLRTERYSAECAVLIDATGTPGNLRDSDAQDRTRLESALPRFLDDRECRMLSFGPIAQASQTSSCNSDPLDLDPDEIDPRADRVVERQELRDTALRRARDLLACVQRNAPGSDVLGALQKLSDQAPRDGEPLHVLVVSDFMQWDRDFRLNEQDLTTPRARAAVIDSLADSDRLPWLAGTIIYPAGYGDGYVGEPEKYNQFDAFWTELLRGRVEADVDATYDN